MDVEVGVPVLEADVCVLLVVVETFDARARKSSSETLRGVSEVEQCEYMISYQLSALVCSLGSRLGALYVPKYFSYLLSRPGLYTCRHL